MVSAGTTRRSARVIVEEMPVVIPGPVPVAQDPGSASLNDLYDTHSASLWRYALRLTGDPHQAHDVVQETLLRAWLHPEFNEDSERSPQAWLFTVARNIVVDDRRSARFRNEVVMPEGTDMREQVDGQDANTAVDNKMMVRDALAQLSDHHRAVLWRSYYLGWPLAQIAEDLQIAEGTVKSRLHYALQALRLTLRETANAR
jgi:RNA polymerase sigma-70 factor (ECF subfamily)